jgi:hypothetical protein
MYIFKISPEEPKGRNWIFNLTQSGINKISAHGV